MAENRKSTATPKLRFPEFRDEDRWEEKPFGEVATFFNGRAFQQSELLDHGKYKVLRVGNFFSNTHWYFSDLELDDHKYCDNGDLLYAWSASFGPRMWQGEKTIYHYHIWKVVEKKVIDKKYLYLALEYETERMKGESTNGLGLLHITKSAIESWKFGCPAHSEQQKIADCLTSLDELIAAQGRKVEALKVYKKGLMQQLFPREGETLPRLRFPEFRDAPEWEDRELAPMTDKVGSGITPLGGDKNYKPTGHPFIRSQNVGWGELLLDDVAFIDEETHASFDATEIVKSDVLLNITGASIGRSAIADSRITGGNVNQHVCIIRLKLDKLNAVLLNQFLISERGQKQIDSFQAGGNRQGLKFAQIRSFEIPVPPTLMEQQRIADFLSALDARIAAEADKLATLKTHKQGLMQQLFPSPKGD